MKNDSFDWSPPFQFLSIHKTWSRAQGQLRVQRSPAVHEPIRKVSPRQITLYSCLDGKVFKDKSPQTVEVSTYAIRAPSLNYMQLALVIVSVASGYLHRSLSATTIPLQARDACESNVEGGGGREEGLGINQNVSMNRPNTMNSHILSLRGGCKKKNLFHQKQNTSVLIERFWVFDWWEALVLFCHVPTRGNAAMMLWHHWLVRALLPVT